MGTFKQAQLEHFLNKTKNLVSFPPFRDFFRSQFYKNDHITGGFDIILEGFSYSFISPNNGSIVKWIDAKTAYKLTNEFTKSLTEVERLLLL